jgi:hypothetical protein
MLGIVIIIVVGGTIMILAAFLESLFLITMKWLGRKDGQDMYALLEWNSNSTLQLQRLAHEQLGLGTWSRTSDDVPVTKRGEKLGIVNITDRRHPRLINPADVASDGDLGFDHDVEGEEAISMTPATGLRMSSLRSRSKTASVELPFNDHDSQHTVAIDAEPSLRLSTDTTRLLHDEATDYSR